MADYDKLKSIFGHFEAIAGDFEITVLNSGHINSTYLIKNRQKRFILQQINTAIFKEPKVLAQNISVLSNHLKNKDYPNEILNQLPFKDGAYLFENSWRILEFIEDSQSFEKVASAKQAYEAARFLSEFYFYLNDLNPGLIKDSIPGFLDFNLRFEQFEQALKNADDERIKTAKNEIDFVLKNQNILTEWNKISAEIPNRIIHADPKISNFLFDKKNNDKIKALIDWDTLMRGPVLYDFGDMVRSHTNLAAEDDAETENIFSSENFKALKTGFLTHLKSKLTTVETENLDLAAQLVIYIQALRFLTDYLNKDRYYHIAYPVQNLNRSKNQIRLLKELIKSGLGL